MGYLAKTLKYTGRYGALRGRTTPTPGGHRTGPREPSWENQKAAVLQTRRLAVVPLEQVVGGPEARIRTSQRPTEPERPI